jgi:hypothetical protein
MGTWRLLPSLFSCTSVMSCGSGPRKRQHRSPHALLEHAGCSAQAAARRLQCSQQPATGAASAAWARQGPAHAPLARVHHRPTTHHTHHRSPRSARPACRDRPAGRCRRCAPRCGAARPRPPALGARPGAAAALSTQGQAHKAQPRRRKPGAAAAAALLWQRANTARRSQVQPGTARRSQPAPQPPHQRHLARRHVAARELGARRQVARRAHVLARLQPDLDARHAPARRNRALARRHHQARPAARPGGAAQQLRHLRGAVGGCGLGTERAGSAPPAPRQALRGPSRCRQLAASSASTSPGGPARTPAGSSAPRVCLACGGRSRPWWSWRVVGRFTAAAGWPCRVAPLLQGGPAAAYRLWHG